MIIKIKIKDKKNDLNTKNIYSPSLPSLIKGMKIYHYFYY